MNQHSNVSTLHKQDGQSHDMLTEYLIPLRPYLDDESLTEVCVNRPREVWTEGRAGQGGCIMMLKP